jgi:hypothetical protein
MFTGPNIKKDNLVFYLDSSNIKSYRHKTNILNTGLWNVGSGSATGFYQNGLTVENERILTTNPWGFQSVIWETRANGSGGADGGWNTDYFTIDNTKLYRHSVWVKRISSTGGGTFYLGTNGGGQCVVRLSDGNFECNPYWHCGGAGGLALNQWYLVVGHCFPHTYSSSVGHPDTGFWTIESGKIGSINGCNVGQDCKFGPSTTSLNHRTYHYYCSDSTTKLQFFQPRIDLCDGNEPSISELLSNEPNNFKNLINRNKVSILNTPTFNSDNMGSLVFDGVNDYINLGVGTGLNIFNSDFTIAMWVMRTGGGNYGNLIGDYYTNSVSTNLEWQIMMGPNSEFNLYKHGTGYVIPNTSSGVGNNNWINLVVSRIGSYIVMYVNGKIIATATDGTIYGTTTGNLNIGIDGNNREEPFLGKIANLKIYKNYGFNITDVSQYYNATKSRFGY